MDHWFHPMRFQNIQECQQHTLFMKNLLNFNNTQDPDFKHDSVFVFREILNSKCSSNKEYVKKILPKHIINSIISKKEKEHEIELIFRIYCKNYVNLKKLY